MLFSFQRFRVIILRNVKENYAEFMIKVKVITGFNSSNSARPGHFNHISKHL